MSQIIYPVNIEFEEWVSQMKNSFPGLSLPNPPKVANWWSWAQQAIAANALPTTPSATKLVFPEEQDWQKWAAYFISSITA